MKVVIILIVTCFVNVAEVDVLAQLSVIVLGEVSVVVDINMGHNATIPSVVSNDYF